MITQLQVEINKVDAKKIRPLRHVELRKGQDFSTTSYLKDYEESTFHMACVVNNEIATCATFYPEKSIKIQSKFRPCANKTKCWAICTAPIITSFSGGLYTSMK